MTRFFDWIAILLVAFFIFAQAYGPSLEGRFFPVVAATEFTRVDPVGETRSRVAGTSARIRDCRFHSIEFRFGTPERYVVADLEFEEGVKNRDQGAFEFGPWLVQLTPDQLDKSQVIVFHRCHPLWLTQSIFF